LEAVVGGVLMLRGGGQRSFDAVEKLPFSLLPG
jgi:hypothetical protein